MLRRLWMSRWARAGGVALALAAWPACAADTEQAPPAAATPGAAAARLDFKLKDMNGNEVNLADYKGRPLIINFWATWCGPCKLEIPAFVSLVDKYEGKRFTVLGISVDDSPEDLQKFAAEYKMNYPVLVGLGHDDLQETYEATFAVPVSWFIRPDGTVALKHEGTATPEWFEAQVKALF
jgi:peroxiredoxin